MFTDIYVHERLTGAILREKTKPKDIIEIIAKAQAREVTDTKTPAVGQKLLLRLREVNINDALAKIGFIANSPLVYAPFSKLDALTRQDLGLEEDTVGIIGTELIRLALYAIAARVRAVDAKQDDYSIKIPNTTRHLDVLYQQVVTENNKAMKIMSMDPVLDRSSILRMVLEHYISSWFHKYLEAVLTAYDSTLSTRGANESADSKQKINTQLRCGNIVGIVDTALHALKDLQLISEVYADWNLALDQLVIHEMMSPESRTMVEWHDLIPAELQAASFIQYEVYSRKKELCESLGYKGDQITYDVMTQKGYLTCTPGGVVEPSQYLANAKLTLMNNRRIGDKLQKIAGFMNAAVLGDYVKLTKIGLEDFKKFYSKDSMTMPGERWVTMLKEANSYDSYFSGKTDLETKLVEFPDTVDFTTKRYDQMSVALSMTALGRDRVKGVDKSFQTRMLEWNANSLNLQRIQRNIPKLDEWNFTTPDFELRRDIDAHNVYRGYHSGDDWSRTMTKLLPESLDFIHFNASRNSKASERDTLTAAIKIPKDIPSTNLFVLSDFEAWLLACAIGGYDKDLGVFKFKNPEVSFDNSIHWFLNSDQRKLSSESYTTDVEQVLHFASDWEGEHSYCRAHFLQFVSDTSGFQQRLPSMMDHFEMEIEYDINGGAVKETVATNELLSLTDDNIMYHNPVLCARFLRSMLAHRFNFKLVEKLAEQDKVNVFAMGYSTRINRRFTELVEGSELGHISRWVPHTIVANSGIHGVEMADILKFASSYSLSAFTGQIAEDGIQLTFKQDVDAYFISALAHHSITRVFNTFGG